jgi:3-hydroxybutyryl-CoA dehydrogenase
MGAGIAEVSARAGCEVIVREPEQDLLDAGKQRVLSSLARAVSKNKISQSESDSAMERCQFVLDLTDLSDVDIVVEAIIEDEEAKLELFRELGEILNKANTLLATNTSSIPINRLASAVKRPENFVGMHFFNPVPLMAVVELVLPDGASPDTKSRAEQFVTETLKKQVVIGPDRAGFIVNALLIPYLLSAVRFYEQGLASKEHIDTAMELGCNLPMGPLKLADFIGLDTVEHIADVIFAELNDSAYEVPALLHEMVEHGQLGRKSGSGFYEYN